MSELAKSPFPYPNTFYVPFGGFGEWPKCLDEWIIIDISNLIRAKPDWKTKFRKQEIAHKWRSEIERQFDSKLLPDLTNYAFEELNTYINIDEKIVTGLHTVPESANKKLISESIKLYDDFGEHLDYHPNTNNQVVDLVHPSLFPLRYGKTQVVDPKDPNNLVVAQYNKNQFRELRAFEVSQKFQWLPSLLKINSSSKRYEFDSYINNLHPESYPDLYDSITDVFNYALPGLNYVLSQFAQPTFVRINVSPYQAYSEEYREISRKLLDKDDNYAEYDEFEKTKAKYLKEFKPDPSALEKFANIPDIKLTEQFPNLKVIVKLANIELSPENPNYPGGSWHVEGCINENIVATILYYYDMENIEGSYLSFRTAFDDPDYDQHDKAYLETLYGIKDEGLMQRRIGSIKAEKDKIIIFPNCYQHHVDAFSLKDKTKSGHRKILCFFVVDPYNDAVVTTKEVPPQQEDWYDAKGQCSVSGIVPDVLAKQLHKRQTLAFAKEGRQELMDERSEKMNPAYAEDDPYNRTFSLCEH